MEALEASQNSPCCPSSQWGPTLNGFHSAIPSPDLSLESDGALVLGYDTVEVAQQWGLLPRSLLEWIVFKAKYGE